ncbi:MAG: J domain-containing protein [Acidimicrobiia bacterium]|nr:J domain-containing protein [Acidimicrobiia bacterium]
MKEPLWQRLRRRGDPAAGDGETAPASRPRRSGRDVVGRLHDARGDGDAPADGDGQLLGLGGLDLTESRQDEYAQWAERMRVKREEKLGAIRSTAPGPAAGASTNASYWTTDALYQESRRVEEENQGVLSSRTELLAVLGLPGGATDEQIQATYRRLAKEHHPDRFPDADEETRARHVETMQRITAAYRALQRSRRGRGLTV